MRDLLLLPVVVVILAACATTEAPEDPRPVSRPPSEPYPDGTPDDVREYLTRVYGQIQPWWHVAMKKARSSYKKKHCVNDRSLEAVVALHFDGDRRVLERSSGCKLFDETALSVFSWVKKLPPRPESMDKTPGRLVLRWRFFRDDRRCEPAFASLEVQAYAPGERMARALSARDWVEARQVLTGHRSEAVLRVLTEAALSSPEPRIRRAALGVASSERVAQALRSDRSAATWNHGVQVLESRQAGALLVQLLGEVATAKKGQDAPRIKRIVDALGRLKSGIPDQTVVALIANPEQSVSLGALALTRDPRVLARARPAWKGNAGMTAALAVRWCSLVEDKAAERAVKASLDSPGRTVALKALERFPLAGLTGEVGALVRSAQVSADDRVLGIRVLARIPDGSLTSLRVALTAREPAVQIAAAEALANGA